MKGGKFNGKVEKLLLAAVATLALTACNANSTESETPLDDPAVEDPIDESGMEMDGMEDDATDSEE